MKKVEQFYLIHNQEIVFLSSALKYTLLEVCLFVCSIFIFLSRESNDGTIFWTNLHPLRSCPFPSFPVVSWDFLPLNLLLVQSHQAEIIIVKCLIQGCNNTYDESRSWT